MQIQNAVIDSTTLGPEGHGIMSAMIDLDYGNCGHQGFGGWNLTKSAALGLFIRRVLNVIGAECWEKLKGKSVRVKREDGFQGRIVAIGHYLRDEWFDPAAEFAATDLANEPDRR